jgi:hypothetical protein
LIIESNAKPTQSDRVVAYFVSIKGEKMLAPDTRVSVIDCGLHPLQWRREEAVGAKEIERLSVDLSRQLWDKKRGMTAAQHLREKKFIDEVKIRCRLRIAQAYSENDAAMNRRILTSIEKREEDLVSMIVSTFDVSKRTSALAIEISPESVNPHSLGKKRAGIIG